MIEQGKVVKLDKQDYALVRIERKGACATCNMCGMGGKMHVDLPVPNTLNAKLDDVVKVEINGVGSFKISLIVYLIPLAIALIAMLTAFLLSAPDWALALIFVVGLSAGFLLVRFIDKKYAKKLGVVPVMIQIINGGKTNE